MKKTAVTAAIAIVAAIGLFLGLLVSIGMISAPEPEPATFEAVDVCSEAPAPGTTVGPYDKEAMKRAAAIVQVGKKLGISQRGLIIALMVAMQESTLGQNPEAAKPNQYNNAGLFQQRIGDGWYGTLEQVNDPAYSAKVFFQGIDNGKGHLPGLVNIPGWEKMAPAEAAEKVQKSGEGYEYAKHQKSATQVLQAVEGAKPGNTDAKLGCDAPTGKAPEGLPTQADFKKPSAHIACPEGSTDLGPTTAHVEGQRVPIRMCSITGTTCTGSDCKRGDIGGKARGEVVISSLAAPHFIGWLKDVRAQGMNPIFSSSLRTHATQIRLHSNSRGNTATPGWSNHESGAAVDISGMTGSYNRHNCSGHHPVDGSCMGHDKNWPIYQKASTKHGAAFHNEEFWHLEWIISNRHKRTVKWLK